MNLELIQKALDNGGTLTIDFHVKKKSEAKKLIKGISDDLGKTIQQYASEGAKWLTTKNYDEVSQGNVIATAFYEKEDDYVGEPFTGSILPTDRTAI